MQRTRHSPNRIRHMQQRLSEMKLEVRSSTTTRRPQHLLNLKRQTTRQVSSGIEAIRHHPREKRVIIRLGRDCSIATIRIWIGGFCNRNRSFDKLTLHLIHPSERESEELTAIGHQARISPLADGRQEKVRFFAVVASEMRQRTSRLPDLKFRPFHFISKS
jgi:hypothetical protein